MHLLTRCLWCKEASTSFQHMIDGFMWQALRACAGMQEISEAIARRSGAVLSPYTILKQDVYPSLQSSSVQQIVEGAPNLRQAENELPVFGMGIPTRQGVETVLEKIGSGPTASERVRRCTVCVNLREEPLLYINGTPYVLREAAGAYTNMKEYTGIDGPRLEALESKLKHDVIAEAHANGGAVQVLREEMQAQVCGRSVDTHACAVHQFLVLARSRSIVWMTWAALPWHKTVPGLQHLRDVCFSDLISAVCIIMPTEAIQAFKDGKLTTTTQHDECMSCRHARKTATSQRGI